MKEWAEPPRVESRWPVAFAIFAVLFLLAVLPERVRLFPGWFTYGIGMAVLVFIAAVGLTAGKPRWCASSARACCSSSWSKGPQTSRAWRT
jgi:peptidoglycan/LPS O-acetylase OafA/YrhL